MIWGFNMQRVDWGVNMVSKCGRLVGTSDLVHRLPLYWGPIYFYFF